MGKLPCGVLAEEDAAAGLEARRNRGVAHRHMVRQQARLAGRPDAGGLENVFQAVRNALHRPLVDPGHEVGLRRPRIGDCALGRDEDEGAQVAVAGFDAIQTGLRHFNGRRGFRTVKPMQFGDRVYVRHGYVRSGTNTWAGSAS